MSSKVFIDGQEGTTGLEIASKLEERDDIELLSVDDTRRKDPAYKRERYANADVVVLCLPDDAAREAVTLDSTARLLDASTAHRTANDWVYGLPELRPDMRDAIGSAQYVSNPGCYPTGFLLAIRPLVDAGLVHKAQKLQVHAISGYSGGGKKLISRYQKQLSWLMDTRPYGLDLQHKHVPEMTCHAELTESPFFLPAVGPFYRGMIVTFALPATAAEEVHEIWSTRYQNESFVRVLPLGGNEALDEGFLSAEMCNHTNRVDLFLSGNDQDVVVCAVLDNLGKGASSAAVQNLNLMLGIDETKGLRAYA